ncbi:TerB family tellurite resistance protein [Candidatus Pelagibacter giovannonii]|uniref:TerB family tellurite resistance protein n=1 Tax=Candidatus Pelagibacter giovannonii TaxID=2563896 RepID=A0A6H1Q1X3_9PROT|nr:TerB family tellurite resistance protein [Candidatus Pelagibacter giovannonii]QIZ20917.1 TerB family tellurite resistance protein [Candidatus Pelagibacter giovannonii]
MNKNKQILKLLLLMAFADKKYMQEEKDFIKSISKKLEVSDENLNQLINEIEQTNDLTKLCRETARGIEDKTDKDKTIKLLSEMMTADKMVHGKEIFALQVIAEEWEMYLP